jgi:hypothetical protein
MKYNYLFNYDHDKPFVEQFEAKNIIEADDKAEDFMNDRDWVDSYYELGTLLERAKRGQEE